ncbi:YebO family protein [Yersinia enterocolitica]|uniref:YebO family protein n=1 Tax=Yersinia enterocolitica TaxID=630 RepID=UPI00398D5CF7
MFDSGFFISPMFIIITMAFLSFIILFFVIRFSVKSNDIIYLLQRILEQQINQNTNNEKKVMGSSNASEYAHTVFIDEALKITPKDLFKQSGDINISVVKGLINLRKEHINEMSKNYGDKRAAENDFDKIIENISRELTIENKKLFSMEYKEHLSDG